MTKFTKTNFRELISAKINPLKGFLCKIFLGRKYINIKKLLHSKVINFDRVKDTLSGICLDLLA